MNSCTLTLAEVTTAMQKIEKKIARINQAYNFNIDAAKSADQKKYRVCLVIWDSYKAYRDKLKAEA